jgi:hypothetical protein
VSIVVNNEVVSYSFHVSIFHRWDLVIWFLCSTFKQNKWYENQFTNNSGLGG